MKLNKLITKKGILFLLIFSVLAFFAERANVFQLVGSTELASSKQYFTMFQFLGPVAGAFLGPVVGVLAVLISEFANFLTLGKEWTALNILRMLPMLFAAYYFGVKRDKISIKNTALMVIAPIFAIFMFIIHPVGRQVWFFSLYWMIPVIISLFPKKYSDGVLMKSLGATFTAHAVGGVVWIYMFNTIPEYWIGLIPVVAYERLLFAGGIALSYVLINTLLDRLDTKFTSDAVDINKKYVLSGKRHRIVN